MSASSRRKGVAGEREVADVWTAAGAEVRGLEGAGDHLIVCAGGLVIFSEVKRAERWKIPEWIEQMESETPSGVNLSVLHVRRNRGRWYGLVALDDLAALVTT